MGRLTERRSPTTCRASSAEEHQPDSGRRSSPRSTWARSRPGTPDPEIQALNPEATIPSLADHSGLPLGRIGDVLPLHRLPLVACPARRSVYRSDQTSVTFPKGAGGKGSAGVAGVDLTKHPGCDQLHRYRAYARSEHLHFQTAQIKNAGREVSSTFEQPPTSRRAAPADPSAFPPGNALLASSIRQSRLRSGVPDLPRYTYVILPSTTNNLRDALRCGSSSSGRWRCAEARSSRPASPGYAPIPKVVLVAAEKTLKQVPQPGT